MARKDPVSLLFRSLLQPPEGLRRNEDLLAYWLNASPTVMDTALDGEDRAVPGVYVIYVHKDVPLARRPDAALDVFHSSVPVSTLDDFAFDVIDPQTGLVLDRSAEGEDYELAQQGEYGYQKEPQPFEVATVTVLGVRSNCEPAIEVATARLAGYDWPDIQQKAIALLWPERLRTEGHYAPVCQRVTPDMPAATQPAREAQR